MASFDLVAQTVVNGVLLGGVYALAAIGLSLVFGIMDVVNISHGHFLMVGGYVAVVLFTLVGLSPLVGMFVAMGLLFVLGYAVERLLLRHVLEREIEQPLLFLFGLALVLQNLGRHVLGSSSRSAELGLADVGAQVGTILIPGARSVTFVVAVIVVAALWAFLRYTVTGMAIRATAQDPVGARYVGIDTKRINSLTFGIGAALAGASGALLSMVFPVNPFVGWSYLLKAFAVVVLGGLGSVVGTLVGGLVLGVVENTGTLVFGGGYRDVITFGIFVAVLIAMPQGLFGRGGD